MSEKPASELAALRARIADLLISEEEVLAALADAEESSCNDPMLCVWCNWPLEPCKHANEGSR